MQTPIENAYWIIPGKFLAGEYPRNPDQESSIAKLHSLLDAGIRVFIDLTTPADGLSSYGGMLQTLDHQAEHLTFPILDVSVPDKQETAIAVLDAIDSSLAGGKGVYIHCWGGVGRTGTMVGCWLARHGLAGDSALTKLEELWGRCPKSRFRKSPETQVQREYITAWKENPATDEAGMLSRARGCFMGQLAGDSLGSLVEFKSADEIRRLYPDGVRELVDGGTWNTLAGQPTDDSEMAIMLARTLIERGRFDAEAVRKAYRFWYDSGPFDCGATIAAGLRGMPNPESQANGALMRVSPLGIFGARKNLWDVAKWASQDAALTHPHPICRQASALFTMAISRAIRTGCSPSTLYAVMLLWAQHLDAEPALRGAILVAAIAPPADFQRHQGWVLIALRNALWQLLHAPSLEEGVVDTVMRGGDTDTNAAICGALLGAMYGLEAVATQWKEMVIACRPEHRAGVAHPRPEVFWPVDALDLAQQLVENTG
ncbi:MAG: ADP-ribosylglycohydrolase family protein [Desulfomicrobium sp.]|nr:ADP-ribosylglycohydrolase family protein [Desulfomicrobium sp.]MBV1719427.1 ADP-ribosylglycohydrolase family protein [Desulfomicrobium sp.]MBV1746535.1 ADP-ribosylglycohydrolase family protein [Desulfomicrobium sp.]